MQYEQSPSIKELATALAAAQGELRSVVKTGKGNYGTYAELAPTLDQVRPILSAQSLSVIQMPVLMDDATTGLMTQLMHKSGEWIRATYPVRMQQQTPQAQGSAITYARRYALMAVVGVAGDDDDGQAGTDGNSPEVRRTPAPKAATKPAQPEAKVVGPAQISAMMTAAKRASGIEDRTDLLAFFFEEIKKQPNEVLVGEVKSIMQHFRTSDEVTV